MKLREIVIADHNNRETNFKAQAYSFSLKFGVSL